MNAILFSLFTFLVGGLLVPVFMLAPLLAKAPKIQVTKIIVILNVFALIGLVAGLYILVFSQYTSALEEKDLFFELLIYAVYCICPLFLKATRKPLSVGDIRAVFLLFAVTAILLCIPQISEQAYLYLATGLTPIYVSIDPIRVLLPLIWCFYEAHKKTLVDPSLLMTFIKNALLFFILLLIVWLVYVELKLLGPDLIDQLRFVGYKSYGALFPVKFLHLGFATSLLIALDAYWVKNYTFSALEERANQSRINNLLIEKDRLIQDLSNRNALVETGALSAGLAHELNQFLARIQINSDEALAQMSRPGIDMEEIKPYLKNTLMANHSASKLIISLKKLFQAGKLEIVSVDLDALVLDVVSLYVDRARKSQIEIKCNLQAKKSFFVSDSLMRQAVANLISNAVDALDAVDRENKVIQIKTALDTSNHYRLEIADNGLGIDSAHEERLFHLFSGDKPSGTGIGLWLSNYIVQRHQGVLKFRNLPDQGGALFLISIPPAQASLT